MNQRQLVVVALLGAVALAPSALADETLVRQDFESHCGHTTVAVWEDEDEPYQPEGDRAVATHHGANTPALPQRYVVQAGGRLHPDACAPSVLHTGGTPDDLVITGQRVGIGDFCATILVVGVPHLSTTSACPAPP